MKFNYLIALVTIGSMALYSCKKDDNGGGGPTISSLSCATAVFSSQAFNGVAYSGTATVSYGGGNGVAYTAGSAIASTGVTGLNATLASGTLSNGSGSIRFNISGTPSSTGTASFDITFGGKNCTINISVTTQVPPGPWVARWNYVTYIDSFYDYSDAINGISTFDSAQSYDLTGGGEYLELLANSTFDDFYSVTSHPGQYFVDSGTVGGVVYPYLNQIYSTALTDTISWRMQTLTQTNLTLRGFLTPYLTNGGLDTVVIRTWEYFSK